MMHSYNECIVKYVQTETVLILVVMDDALVHSIVETLLTMSNVS